MSTGGLSKARIGRMHDVMAGYVDAIGTRAVGGREPIHRETIFRILMTQRAWTSPNPPTEAFRWPTTPR